MADTYYTPSGDEHVQQTPNAPAETIAVDRAMAGDHVHTWSKDSGVTCLEWNGKELETNPVPRDEKCKKETGSE